MVSVSVLLINLLVSDLFYIKLVKGNYDTFLKLIIHLKYLINYLIIQINTKV